jgi:ribosomal protein S18 acetylase RimI-like enzyme
MMQELNQTMATTLRDAGPDDEPFLLQVFACTRAAELALVPWTDEQRADFLQMQFNAQHSHYHERYPDADYKVILRDDEPVGRLYLLREKELIRIMDITVLPQYRNCGTGSDLIRGVLDEAVNSGRNVQIYVETFNPSFELFKKIGFSILEEEGINYLLEWNVAKAATELP